MLKTSEQRILGRSVRLTRLERPTFDRIFESGDGYVLDFSDGDMAEWFEENCGFNIFQSRFQRDGTSKGKTLRCFIEVAEPRLVARTLRSLWAYRLRKGIVADDGAEESRLASWFEQFTTELDNASSIPLEDAIRNFSEDTTLAKLNDAIRGDLIADKPDVALDRVHTYCIKRLRHILAARGRSFDAKTPLDALWGAYGLILKETGTVSEFALPALRFQHLTFKGLNDARNKRSLAHDTELLDFSESRFVIDCTLASLAFIERLEAASIAPLAPEPI